MTDDEQLVESIRVRIMRIYDRDNPKGHHNAALVELEQLAAALREAREQRCTHQHHKDLSIRISGTEALTYQGLATLYDRERERVRELERVVKDLLLSADCSWEDRNEGHDWAESCRAARHALAGEGE